MTLHPIAHLDTGVIHEYAPWDDVISLDGRLWHACPVCGLGVCSPIQGPPMAHAHCIAEYENRRPTDSTRAARRNGR